MRVQRFFQILWYRRLTAVLTFSAALLASLIIITIERPAYVASASLVSVGGSSSASASGNVLELGDIMTLIQSTNVLNRAIRTLKIDSTPNTLRSELAIRGFQSSNVIDITASTSSAELSPRVANAVADASVKAYHDLAGLQYAQVISSLKSQLINQQHIIASVDQKLQNAAQTDAMAASSHPLDSIMESITSLQSQRAQAFASLVADSASANAGLNADLHNDAELQKVISEQALLNDPYYQALRAGQSKDAAEYQFMRASFTKAYPGLVGLRSKIASETETVRKAGLSTINAHVSSSPTYASMLLASRAATAQVAGDKARLESIDHQIQDAQDRLHDLPSLGVPANQMRLIRDSASNAYQQLETRLQMTLADQQQAASLNSIIVMNYASSAHQKEPLSRLIMVLGLMVLGSVIGIISLLEKFNPKLRDALDIERHYQLPLLGIVGKQ